VSQILVTGGAGYIGSHTVLLLLEAGYDVVVVDNLCNSSQTSLLRVAELTGKSCQFHQADICDAEALDQVFQQHQITSVIHFAGLKAVGESVEQPLRYYQNNVGGTVTLCQIMAKHGVKSIVFSSSATVYGDEAPVPYVETSLPKAINPYGRTKLYVEELLKDTHQSDSEWSVSLLRYFNPVGAHPSGAIGEDPKGIPNNLMPFISQVAVGKRDKLSVFGGDYNTPDGTCVRDYIHVMDLAHGHVEALKQLSTKPGVHTFNLGSGKGTSVLELVRAFETVNEIDVPFEIVGRRAGDLPAFYADAEKAREELGWATQLTIEDMCRDSWNWQRQNPYGYTQASDD
jgi:UDP-glucose 4-epimerase